MKEQKITLEFEDIQGEGNQYGYIHFKKSLKSSKEGESKRQVTYDGFGSEEAKKEGVELIVDFDEDNKIIGIEIISNRDIIPENLRNEE